MSAMVGQQPHGGHGAHTAGAKKRVPGFPQDMMMVMDDEVAKPETYGMAKGWTGAVQGMMAIVRVLPPDKYNEVIRRVREAASAPEKQAPPSAPAPKHLH